VAAFVDQGEFENGCLQFLARFIDTYQSLSGWIKFAWLVAPLTFTLGITALVLHYRIIRKRVENIATGDLAYTICRDKNQQLHVYRHGRQPDHNLKILLLEDRLALVEKVDETKSC
jgi:hypothetical protein